jgi:pimeloyl-ACP methyl ester carboxylesterase
MAVHRRAALIAVLFLAAIATGHAAGQSADPMRLSGTLASDRSRAPLIVIPGLLGSRLANRATGMEVWPGTTRQLMTSSYLELALRIDPVTLEPVDDGLIASDVFESAVGQDFYGRMIDFLLQTGGYSHGTPGEPAEAGEARLYTLAYDWRQDNIRAARALDALIEQIRSDYHDPGLRVDVIAHSMGGLILRYYERYGTDDVLGRNAFRVTGAGASKLRRVVMLGVPNQGSVTALHSFLTGYRVWLSRLPTTGIATMPSMYQLLPHPQVPWIATTRGKPLSLDPFDINVWKNFEWSVFSRNVRGRIARQPDIWPDQEVFERYFEKHLERGRRFAWSLTVPTGDARLIEPLVFGGDCLPTLARVLVERQDGHTVARLRPEQITNLVPGIDYDRLMYEPGDGSVTAASLIGQEGLDPLLHEANSHEIGRASFVCELHESVTSNGHVLDAVLRHLQGAD